MIYFPKSKKEVRYKRHFLFYLMMPPVTLIAMSLVVMVANGQFYWQGFAVVIGFATIWVWINRSGYMAKTSRLTENFIKCETDNNGVSIEFKDKTDYIPWKTINKVHFEDRSYYDVHHVDINLGVFVVTDISNNKFEIPPAVDKINELVLEIVNNAKLKEYHLGVLGEASSGKTFWKRPSDAEEVSTIKDVKLFTYSKTSEYVIVILIILFVSTLFFLVASIYAGKI